MTRKRDPQQLGDDVKPDLVEYLIVTAPHRSALAELLPAIASLVDDEVIRVLDLVVLVRDSEGAVSTIELDALEELAPLAPTVTAAGELLSDHDLELASYAVRPRTAGIVLVTEDRWAEPLSDAARRAGGQIVGGERIHAARIEAALTRPGSDQPRGS